MRAKIIEFYWNLTFTTLSNLSNAYFHDPPPPSWLSQENAFTRRVIASRRAIGMYSGTWCEMRILWPEFNSQRVYQMTRVSGLRNDMNKGTFYKERKINNRCFDFLSKQNIIVPLILDINGWPRDFSLGKLKFIIALLTSS